MIQLRSFPTKAMAETINKIFSSISNALTVVTKSDDWDYNTTWGVVENAATPPYSWCISATHPLTESELQIVLHGIDYAILLRLADESNKVGLAKSSFATMWEFLTPNRHVARRFDIDRKNLIVTRNR